MSKVSSSYLLENFSREKPLIKESKKLRVFQTSLTDTELGAKNLIVTQFPDNDEHWGKVFSDENGKNFPLLHGIFQKKKDVSSFIAERRIVKPHHPENWKVRFDERITDLKEISLEDGVESSEKSVSYAKEFLGKVNFSDLPSIFLSGNGNVRIVWSNIRKEQVGLQFKDDGIVQYVFFKINNSDNLTHEHIMGMMKIDSIIELIGDLGLNRILDGHE